MKAKRGKLELKPGHDWLRAKDYWRAASRWQDVSWDEDAFIELMDGLAPHVIGGRNMTYVEASDRAIKAVNMLLGPHYRTMIKAFLARRGNAIPQAD